jgi:hypothetical protein
LNQTRADLGIPNESSLQRFGISGYFRSLKKAQKSLGVTTGVTSGNPACSVHYFPWRRADVFRCDLLNQFFNETESRFGQEGAILPLFNLGLELVDPIFGGSMLRSHSLRCKFEYLGYSATPRLHILLPRGGVFEVGNQLMKKCHLATPARHLTDSLIR